MSEFYSALMLARHVSDLIGPSSGAFFTSCIRRFGTRITTYQICEYNAPDDERMRSETCRANISAE